MLCLQPAVTAAAARRARRTRSSTRVSATPPAPSETEDAYAVEAKLQALRNVVESREQQLSVARSALRLAEQRLSWSNKSTVVAEPEAYDADYGFNRRFVGLYSEAAFRRPDGLPPIPSNAISMAVRTFRNEVTSLLAWLAGDRGKELQGLESERATSMRQQLEKLTLSNDAIWERHHARPEVRAPFVIKGPYLVLCWLLDNVFNGRPLARLWYLETVARIPYNSYNSMLQLYESLGWWRLGAQAQRIHFAEAWNEYHHLAIMESLGGDRVWRDRFFAGHSAVAYYWILCFAWLISPTLAYNFSELIEAHAVDTYGQFCDENEELLKTLPAPRIAIDYFTKDLYLYDEFQTSIPQGERRPRIENLLDVFRTIRDDEAQHVQTMHSCQDPEVLLRSPNYESAFAAATAAAILAERVVASLPEDGLAGASAIASFIEDFIETGGGGLL